MPLLRRFIQFSFIITLVTAFTALFSLIFVMTGGGPGFGTTTLEFYIYQSAFSTGDFGTAATAGAILFVVVAVVSVDAAAAPARSGRRMSLRARPAR